VLEKSYSISNLTTLFPIISMNDNGTSIQSNFSLPFKFDLPLYIRDVYSKFQTRLHTLPDKNINFLSVIQRYMRDMGFEKSLRNLEQSAELKPLHIDIESRLTFQLMNLIIQGKTLEAISAIENYSVNDHIEQKFHSERSKLKIWILLRVKALHIIELVKHNSIQEAIEYISIHFYHCIFESISQPFSSPSYALFSKKPDILFNGLNSQSKFTCIMSSHQFFLDVISLIGYQHPLESPLSYLFSDQVRIEIAESTRRAFLKLRSLSHVSNPLFMWSKQFLLCKQHLLGMENLHFNDI